jgi:hypothetical protein
MTCDAESITRRNVLGYNAVQRCGYPGRQISLSNGTAGRVSVRLKHPRRLRHAYSPLLLAAALAGCATRPAARPAVPSPAPAQPAPPPAPIETILQKQIYQMTPVEAGRYIAWVHQAEPDLRKRIAAIGRKNIGQPYVLNLLGEFPYEVHDDLPMFSLDHSDCVVFAEHTYAMALSRRGKNSSGCCSASATATA